MLTKAASELERHGRSEDVGALFDRVIFCANVTYADGGFKGGTFPRPLPSFHSSTWCWHDQLIPITR